MYLRNAKFALVMSSAALALMISAGCDKEQAPVAVPVSTPTSPAESFEELVTALKEGLELPGGQASGFYSATSGTSSRFQVHNTVSSELIPPAQSGDPYRGVITVTTQSVYSLRKSAEEEQDKDEDNAANRGSSLLDESAESGTGFSSFDQGLVTESPDNKVGRTDIDTVQRRADKVDRKFELVYKNDRWELVTAIDKETDASIENAFARALRLQP